MADTERALPPEFHAAVSYEAAEKSLARYMNLQFKKSGQKPRAHIPANPEDDDLVLSRFITQQKEQHAELVKRVAEVSRLRAENERLTKERDSALDNADFWERELNNFRRNAAHRAEELAKEKVESAESRISVAMEIVKELVELEPTREETPLQWCALCESEAVYFDETIEHKPDCLILRSQALISKEGK